MKKIVIILLVLIVSMSTYSQNLPTLNWRQGNFGKINLGMTKSEVEQALGVKLKFWRGDNLNSEYTLNYTNTWINNERISFSCRGRIHSELIFFRDRLFIIWFCTNANIKSILTRKFGPGSEIYFGDENERRWRDENIKIDVSYKNGSVWIEDLKISAESAKSNDWHD